MKLNVTINGLAKAFDVDPDMPLLWFIRDEVKLKGTKFGCGMGVCGACSVHVDGELIRSCSYPAQLAAGKNITTIEGPSVDKNHVHPVQQAWIDVQVPQVLSAWLHDGSGSPSERKQKPYRRGHKK